MNAIGFFQHGAHGLTEWSFYVTYLTLAKPSTTVVDMHMDACQETGVSVQLC